MKVHGYIFRFRDATEPGRRADIPSPKGKHTYNMFSYMESGFDYIGDIGLGARGTMVVGEDWTERGGQ